MIEFKVTYDLTEGEILDLLSDYMVVNPLIEADLHKILNKPQNKLLRRKRKPIFIVYTWSRLWQYKAGTERAPITLNPLGLEF